MTILGFVFVVVIVTHTALVITLSASSAALIYSSVLFGIFVPLRAVRDCSYVTSHVLAMRDRLQVFRVNTNWIPTQVIQFHTLWYRAYELFVRYLMGVDSFTLNADYAIALDSVPQPNPASITVLLRLKQKVFLHWISLRTFSSTKEYTLNCLKRFATMSTEFLHVSPPCDFQIGVGGASSGVASIPGGFDGRPYPLDKNNTKGVV